MLNSKKRNQPTNRLISSILELLLEIANINRMTTKTKLLTMNKFLFYLNVFFLKFSFGLHKNTNSLLSQCFSLELLK